eukprot:2503173-Prymnesium_polylepis.2
MNRVACTTPHPPCAVEGFSRLPEHRRWMQGLAHPEGGVRPGVTGGPSRVPGGVVIPLQRSTSPHLGHPHNARVSCSMSDSHASDTVQGASSHKNSQA